MLEPKWVSSRGMFGLQVWLNEFTLCVQLLRTVLDRLHRERLGMLGLRPCLVPGMRSR